MFTSTFTIGPKVLELLRFKPKLQITNQLWFNPLPNDKFLDWSKLKAFADDEINVTLFWNQYITLWEKEKMLVISIFSFPHNVFKQFLFQGH